MSRYTVDDYLHEKIPYGGIWTERGNVILALQERGCSKKIIDGILFMIDQNMENYDMEEFYPKGDE